MIGQIQFAFSLKASLRRLSVESGLLGLTVGKESLKRIVTIETDLFSNMNKLLLVTRLILCYLLPVNGREGMSKRFINR